VSGRCVQGQPSSLLGDGAERFPARSARYVATEIVGYLSAQVVRHGAPPGLSVHVLDSLNAYRIVASWRSEDYGGRSFGSRVRKDATLREWGRATAERLNAEHEASLA
jgi:hypothetical protein